MQFPNWPIWVALALYFVPWLGNDTLTLTSQWLTKVVLLYWSYLEIRFGVNGFRKSLGVFVALSQIYGLINLLNRL